MRTEVYQRAQRVSEQLQRDQDMELTRRRPGAVEHMIVETSLPIFRYRGSYRGPIVTSWSGIVGFVQGALASRGQSSDVLRCW